jgi:3',5'-cyclic AMP phosphodiesterase CpdA
MRLHWDDVDFWLTTGDNAYPQGTARDWQDRIFVFYQELLRRQPFFPTPGNHDYGSGSLDPYLQSLALPEDALKPEDQERYYGFDWGPVHFSMLDSERAVDEVTPEPGDDMVDWFTDDLADAADRPWRVAAWHHPAYLTDPARRAKDAVLERLVPAAEAGGAQLVLQGHSHVYERFDHLAGGEKVAEGTSYVVTGGGGAPLDEVTEDDDHVEDTDLAADLALRDFGQSVNHFMIFEVDRCRLVGRAIDLDGHEFDRVERVRSAPECAGR